MEERNLDFDIEVTRDQWMQLGRTADALGPEKSGFDWSEDQAEEIRVFLRDDDVPGSWSDFVVSNPENYGPTEREIARFRFNDGRPFADVDAPAAVQEPVRTAQEIETMERELVGWVRGKWQALLRESGLHYERGHIPEG